MLSACRGKRQASALLFCAMLTALISAAGIARGDDVSPYCAQLRQVAGAALGKAKFADMIGEPREGNYMAAKVALPGWENCVFYGTRTYTCDSPIFPTKEQGDRAFATTLDAVKLCLQDSWAEDSSRSSPGYAVLHDNRQVAAITINTALTEAGAHVVRLILFLRTR
jgi:hypothetical protein